MVLYIAGLSLHRVPKMLTKETFFLFKTFYQMKEDRRPNASLFSLGVGSSHPRDGVIPGRFARAHFL